MEEVISGSDYQFHEMDRGTNYAQVRYLCYYLQEKGLLFRFYREFRDAWREDPTGLETLKKVLCEDDMAVFMKTWEPFVLKLKYKR